ncbi:hypothetical protein C8R44DRAFT_887094 [Mycena epipterygia]|nr:hypothetical protein C8R44DRAFT_894663 [Mycena epipterygia]KAJ7104641.1 hypothetical protein C8R44DRAFT_887094 [Mycena epipterygia]
MHAPAPKVLLCTPIYMPDPGHEDQHMHQGAFFAIVSKDWKGVVTSQRTLIHMLKTYPDARTFKAETWSKFLNLWNLDCTDYHNHDGELPVTPDSSAPSSPSTLTDSTASRPPSVAPPPPSPPKASLRERQRQRNALHSEFLAAEDARIAKEAAEKLSKDDLAFLAGFRPGPGQISPQRANQLFTRVLGLRGAAPPWLQHPIEHGNEPPALIHEDGRSAAASRADMEGLGEGAPVLYAVSGRSRVFQDRDRAVAVLKRTPGAELMFSRDEGEVWDFLGEDPTLNLNI